MRSENENYSCDTSFVVHFSFATLTQVPLEEVWSIQLTEDNDCTIDNCSSSQNVD